MTEHKSHCRGAEQMMQLGLQITSMAQDEGDDEEEVDYTPDELQQLHEGQDWYGVAATGARISLRRAKGHIYEYCSKLPSDM